MRALSRIRSATRFKPIVYGVSSVAIRRVLYGEAVDLALAHPLTGIGASKCGFYSCGGWGAYPHSTFLQAFAELGVVGGCSANVDRGEPVSPLASLLIQEPVLARGGLLDSMECIFFVL